jgi:3-oxoadipate enol-lactonase
VWDKVVARRAPLVSILTYDCRGHGASSKMPGPYRLETFADDLADLLAHVGWNKVYLAGASMGGSTAMQFAVKHPQHLVGLGLIDTTSWYGPDAQKNWEQRARQAEEQGLAGLMDFQESRWFSDRFRTEHPDDVARCRALFLANDIPSYAASCRMLGTFDVRDGLATVRVPTAVVVGEEDYATPLSMAQDIHQRIAGSTLQVIPQARHLTFIERPDAVSDVIATLIGTVSSPA